MKKCPMCNAGLTYVREYIPGYYWMDDAYVKCEQCDYRYTERSKDYIVIESGKTIEQMHEEAKIKAREILKQKFEINM